jgi:outer membrane protein TolC
MRRFLLLTLLTLTVNPWIRAEEPGSRDAILRTALRDNETIKAARAKLAAMEMRVPQEKAWEDLMTGLELQRAGTTRLDKVTDAEFMLLQALPVSGKNLSRGRAAMAEALSTYEELRRAELDLVSRVQGAYYRLAGGYGQLAITQRNQGLLKDFSEISRKKYEVGTATQSDVLLAETELAKLSENVAMIQRDISDQQTQLNVLMNRPADAPLAQPEPLQFQPSRLGTGEAQALAAKLRPEVLMAARQTQASKARLQLAHRQWIPDPQLQIKARQFSGMPGIQEYDTGIVVSIPWTNPRKYSAGVTEAADTLSGSLHQYEAVRTEVVGLVRDQLKKIDTFASNYRLFHDQIMPTAALSVKSTRAGYETDKNTILELLTAQRTLQDIESSSLNQLIEHQAAIAELDAIVGNSPFLDTKDTLFKKHAPLNLKYK